MTAAPAPTARDRVIVVAEPDEVDDLVRELQRAPERNGTVVGSLAATAAASTSLPPRRPLLTMARDEHASVVVLGRAAQSDDDVVEQASILHEEGVRIRTMSLFYEQWLGKLPITELERVSLLFDIGEVHAARYARVKRLLDVALASCGCVALAVITPVVVVGDLVANRGPLLFRQPRTGRNGVEFEMLKFRTMRAASTAAEPASPEWTAEGDARVTRFGRVLRRTHLDELPAGRERPPRRALGRRPAARAAPGRRRARGQDPVLPDPPSRAARAHRVGAGQVPVRGERGRDAPEAAVRGVLPAAPEPGARPADRRPHRSPRRRAGRPMTAGERVFDAQG